jgi:hypothetical protein
MAEILFVKISGVTFITVRERNKEDKNRTSFYSVSGIVSYVYMQDWTEI